MVSHKNKKIEKIKLVKLLNRWPAANMELTTL